MLHGLSHKAYGLYASTQCQIMADYSEPYNNHSMVKHGMVWRGMVQWGIVSHSMKDSASARYIYTRLAPVTYTT